MKIFDKLRVESKSLPGLIVDIVSGTAGLFLPAQGRSAVSHAMDGDYQRAYGAAAWNYVGVNTEGNDNSLRNMFRRAAGMKVVFLGKIFKGVISEF